MTNIPKRGEAGSASDKWMKPMSADSLNDAHFRRPSLDGRYTPNEPVNPSPAPGKVKLNAAATRDAVRARMDGESTGGAQGAVGMSANAGSRVVGTGVNGGGTQAANPRGNIIHAVGDVGANAIHNAVAADASELADSVASAINAATTSSTPRADGAGSPPDATGVRKRRSRLANQDATERANAEPQASSPQPSVSPQISRQEPASEPILRRSRSRASEAPFSSADSATAGSAAPQAMRTTAYQTPELNVLKGYAIPSAQAPQAPASQAPFAQTQVVQPQFIQPQFAQPHHDVPAHSFAPLEAQNAAAPTASEPSAPTSAPQDEPEKAAQSEPAMHASADLTDLKPLKPAPYATPAAGGFSPVMSGDEPDVDDDERDAVPSSQMAQPAPVPLMTVAPPPRKRGRAVFIVLLIIVLLAAAALALWQTGVLPQLLGVEKTDVLSIPSIFMTATPEVDKVSAAIPESSSRVDSFNADATEAAAPATIGFSAHTSAGVTDIRLLSEQGSSLYVEGIKSTPDETGILWEFTVKFDAAFEGDVRAYIRDADGVWDSSGASLHISVK